MPVSAVPNRLEHRIGRRIIGAALAVCSLIVSPGSFAWGKDGHRIVAQIAADHLTPAAASSVNLLLAGEPEPTLAGVSSWADEVRTKETGPLHYVNFPRGTCQFTPKRDCPDGRCVIGGIEQSIATLRYSGATPAERNVALKNLVHFAGDVHQPLHAGLGEDRGGNTVQLQWAGAGSNLHALWDSGLIASTEPDWRRYVLRLAPKAANVDLKTLDGLDWALESCAIVASDGFYPADAKPGPEYLTRWQPTVDERLNLAGLRLAALLNALFPG